MADTPRRHALISHRSTLLLSLTAITVVIANILLVRDAADRAQEQRETGAETRLAATLDSLEAALREREAVGAAYVATGTDRYRFRADRLGAQVRDRLADIGASDLRRDAKELEAAAQETLTRTDATLELRRKGQRELALQKLESAGEIPVWEPLIARLRDKQQQRIALVEQQGIADQRNAERHATIWGAATLALLAAGGWLVRRDNARLSLMAEQDPLTRLKNRRVFEDRLAQSFQLARRHNHPLSVLMIDVDHFKAYNDAHGHVAGDVALAAVADTLVRTARASDVVARFGGEEFVLLLPHTDGRQAHQAAQRIRTALAGDPTPHQPLTISVGIGYYRSGMEDPEDLIKSADRALYQAKYAGRDVVAFDD
ncbi:MAG: diguanylate cyclase [Armatimonadaceae bacterium]